MNRATTVAIGRAEAAARAAIRAAIGRGLPSIQITAETEPSTMRQWARWYLDATLSATEKCRRAESASMGAQWAKIAHRNSVHMRHLCAGIIAFEKADHAAFAKAERSGRAEEAAAAAEAAVAAARESAR